MIHTPHIHSQLDEYALGLLSVEEQQAVEAHTAVCPSCQNALADEMQIGTLLKSTLHAATQVENGRLRQLMPPAPQQKRPFWRMSQPWQRQLASLAVLLLLVFGGFGAYQVNRGPSSVVPPTSLAITATYTVAPTETAVSDNNNAEPKGTAEAKATEPDIQPAATPIALLTH